MSLIDWLLPRLSGTTLCIFSLHSAVLRAGVNKPLKKYIIATIAAAVIGNASHHDIEANKKGTRYLTTAKPAPTIPMLHPAIAILRLILPSYNNLIFNPNRNGKFTDTAVIIPATPITNVDIAAASINLTASLNDLRII